MELARAPKAQHSPAGLSAALTAAERGFDVTLIDRADRIGQAALDRLADSLGKNPIVGDIRGRGCMFGVEIVSDKETRSAAPELAEKIYYRCLDQGLSFKISQGCVLTLSPPLIIAREDLDAALTIVETAISETVS